MNKVNNGPLQRLIRTIGYILVLISTVVLAVSAIEILKPDSISNLIKPVYDYIFNTGPFVNFFKSYTYTLFSLGLLLLLWTQTKSYFIRIFFTLVGLFTILLLASTGMVHNILPFTIKPIDFINTLVGKSKWIPLSFIVLSLFPIYLVLAYRKPDAASASTTSAGFLLLVLSIVALTLTSLFPGNAVVNSSAYEVISQWLLAISYVVTLLGSIFGVLALFRK